MGENISADLMHEFAAEGHAFIAKLRALTDKHLPEGYRRNEGYIDVAVTTLKNAALEMAGFDPKPFVDAVAHAMGQVLAQQDDPAAMAELVAAQMVRNAIECREDGIVPTEDQPPRRS